MDVRAVAGWQPDFSLFVEDRDITETIKRGVNIIRFTDNGAATGEMDTLEITLISDKFPLPPKGVILKLALGFNGELVNKGSFTVCQVSSSGPPRKVTITATAAPVNGSRHGNDVSASRSRTLEEMTLGDIVRTVASENGLTGHVSSSLAGIVVPSLVQTSESDISMMQRLATRYGAISKLTNGFWLFLENGASQSIVGKDLAELTITPDMVSSWSYQAGNKGGGSDSKKEDEEWKAGKFDAQTGKIRSQYYDSATGEIRTHEVSHNGASTENPHVQPDKHNAEHDAAAKAKRAKKAERTFRLTAPCTPEMLRLTAESRITTRGFGREEDRGWLTERIEWEMSDGGFSLSFSLASEITPKKGKSESDETWKAGRF